MEKRIYSLIKNNIYTMIAERINSFSRYYDEVIQISPLPWDEKKLLHYIKNSKKSTRFLKDLKQEDLEGLQLKKPETRSILLLNGNLNYSYNIQHDFEQINRLANRHSRYVVVLYNYYLSWLYKLASRLGLRKAKKPSVFLTQTDLNNIAKLSNLEIVSQSDMIFIPFYFLGLGPVINKVLKGIPLINKLSLVSVFVLRPVKKSLSPSLSIIIPARNEKGNIENALKRIPDMGCKIEVIFVEGNSSDKTMEEIERVAKLPEYLCKYKIHYYKQPGKGKFDAVKVGFEKATMEILTILDADLTMPPELLPQFYLAYSEGKADFINGSRLVYPMEGEAMKPLNFIGNKFFAKSLGYLLSAPLGDSLCGTKMFPRADYKRMKAWRNDFGDFDPFGDFEMLFSASVLELGMVDVPVRYLDRTYGSTQINRFRDGLVLLKMTLIGLFYLKLKRQ